ncbi:fimbrial protein [Edwardsiella tarda]|uniref:F4 family fimbrial subunit n=1 Tax=Edwardsiella tarda TaxID=636 RepID=UPI00351BFC04
MKMKKTLLALALATGAVSGSAMAWQEGNFNGSVDIGGNIVQQQPSWQWMVGNESGSAVNLNLSDAVVSGNNNVWSGVGAKSYPILLGKTKFKYSGVGTGMSPVITYGGEGFAINFPADAAPKITLTAKGKTDTAKTGVLKFNMNMYALADVIWSKAGTNGNDLYTYQMIADTAKSYGNGYLQNAGYVKTLTSAKVKDGVARLLGADMITLDPGTVETASYTRPNLFDDTSALGLQGAYGSEFVANSGELTFPKDATPSDWKATLAVTVSYQ